MPLRSISTSCSVRKRQSPRRRFFLVSPANCTRSSLDHVVAEVLEDTTHNAVLAAVDLNAHLAVVVLVGVFNGIGMHLTILQLNAVGNLLQVFNCHVLVEEYVIHLLLQELWVR